MGSFISQQPNGLFCRFSSVVDCVTDYNMTRRDYILSHISDSAEDAAYRLDHHLRPYELVEEHFCPREMTMEEFQKIQDEMSKPILYKSVDEYMDMPWTIVTKRVKDEDREYIYGRILELDGVQSSADTILRLFMNLQEVLKNHIELCIEHNIPISTPLEVDTVIKL